MIVQSEWCSVFGLCVYQQRPSLPHHTIPQIWIRKHKTLVVLHSHLAMMKTNPIQRGSQWVSAEWNQTLMNCLLKHILHFQHISKKAQLNSWGWMEKPWPKSQIWFVLLQTKNNFYIFKRCRKKEEGRGGGRRERRGGEEGEEGRRKGKKGVGEREETRDIHGPQNLQYILFSLLPQKFADPLRQPNRGSLNFLMHVNGLALSRYSINISSHYHSPKFSLP